ncbi:bifunctional PTS system fructose-specific transporter subunit IIA/HPr protein [Gallibacterium salpingitidis]|uniref:Multiphosphoryl transfer protein n=1 Tax=Gallibacterium salpingitidis TaxID=505341 RepID=A0A1A7QC33_9PAST|nr:fused PTS fructose transporter subunit IIA/HPr protein [Gallibacterium salpingitidis]OBW95065.1 bifunctional PTS system fructose-specific transporter subunit IIA/HPr protein [Gallibacterium salpingitidis]OBX08092.1 bifunctional PTS system fructose-specific transporter subunit IIA/HPr protein [Gallibacterium salpingitidis]OBX11739.1 bifunctional PTS system fructose-specific transporter subunit IIA/HPr protein [Gallibacterium salpingitidis]
MFNLIENDIHLGEKADDKQQAITAVAQAFINKGLVEEGYLQGMLAREQQTSTFLGNGIAIPHGTLDTRHLVKQTGVQIFQFPNGVKWSDDNIAYLVIGIAAKSDEHLAILRQLTHLLGDEEIAEKLAKTTNPQDFISLFNGNIVDAAFISLDVDTNSLLTLTAINAAKLQEAAAVDTQFVSEVIASPALPLGNGIWVNDSAVGNSKNAIAVARPKQAFQHNNKQIAAVVTVASVDEKVDNLLVNLLDPQCQQVLLKGNAEQVQAALQGKAVTVAETAAPATQAEPAVAPAAENASAAPQAAPGQLEATFIVKNEHGLHARPSAVLINEVKKYKATIQVRNVDRDTAFVSAKSLMKVVGLGTTKGQRLCFVAEGEDAEQALKGIGEAINAGLGE